MGKHFGKCALCGKECELTFEHIPPRVACNSSPAKPVNGKVYFDALNGTKHLPWDLQGLQYTNQQKGMGLYSLCSKCNNDTGEFYGRDYFEFVKRAFALFKSKIPSEGGMVDFYNVYPLRIIKQICSMFCSIAPQLDELTEMRSFVLNKESKHLDTSRYRIQMFFNRGTLFAYNGCACLSLIDGSLMNMSELIVPPFVFELYYYPKTDFKYGGFDITNFSNCDYNSVAKVTLPIIIKEVNSIIPFDYRTKEEIVSDTTKDEQ